MSGGHGSGAVGSDGRQAFNLHDVEAIAVEKLAPGALAYYAGGANDEVTLRDNRDAFGRWRILPRILPGTAVADTSVELLGRRWEVPVAVAPLAIQRLAHPDGEVAVARACAERGVTMSLSTVASATIEEVAQPGGPRWFQLYYLDDPVWNRSLVERAEAAGYEAIVMTVDAAVIGRRERDLRVALDLPPGVRYSNLVRTKPDGSPDDGPELYANTAFRRGLGWKDLDTLVAMTKLPVIVKGVLNPLDAMRAVDAGAAGVIVSNHGGRQLDYAVSALDVLADVVDAVGHRVPCLYDGGIRRGTDILMALALGARAVMLGRPVLWGLAWDGEAGVGAVLDMLLAELRLALVLAGSPRAADLDPSYLIRHLSA